MTPAAGADSSWSTFGPDRTVAANAATWRSYSDAVNARLVHRWLPPHCGSVLKTDLFDEVLTPGLLPALREHADRVVGVDLSPAVVEAARTRNPGSDARRADVRDLPFADASFDAVVSNSTLDHLPTWEAIGEALVELRRVLLPGGRLIVTFDNAANPVVALRGHIAARLPSRVRAQAAPYEQGPAATPAQLRVALRSAGFDVADEAIVMHCPRLPAIAVAQRLDRRAPGGAARRARRMLAFEALDRLPTRTLTGYFTAALAVRPSAR